MKICKKKGYRSRHRFCNAYLFNFTRFLVDFGSILGTQIVPKTVPKWSWCEDFSDFRALGAQTTLRARKTCKNPFYLCRFRAPPGAHRDRKTVISTFFVRYLHLYAVQSRLATEFPTIFCRIMVEKSCKNWPRIDVHMRLRFETIFFDLDVSFWQTPEPAKSKKQKTIVF